MTASTLKCSFVSDLHLFANRSNAHRHLDAVAHAALRADVFVLGGDIFDFRWACIPMHKAVDRALQWLAELASACPKCEFHMVLGNHDHHQAFIDGLVELEPRTANLSWHRYYVRLGSSVFLHGDVADRNMDARKLAESREKCLDVRRRGALLNALYDAVVLARLHRPVPHLVYSKYIVVRRISKYLQSIGQGPADGVHNVYFGHTHIKLTNYFYHGLHFHNGGAPIKGHKYHVLDAVL